jgi:hypothetical protein
LLNHSPSFQCALPFCVARGPPTLSSTTDNTFIQLAALLSSACILETKG